jgi:ribosome biogenesis GTPase
MTITDLGFTYDIKSYLKDNDLTDLSICRVTQEHRERYIVSTGENEYEAEITGNLRFTASSREDFPAVGDWVAVRIYDPDLAIIHKILPRKSILERQAVGKFGEKQIISTNIDVALIVQSVDNNFSINRLERYLSVCYSSGIEPVLVISKIDLSTKDHLEKTISALKTRDKKIKYLLLSNVTREGLDEVLSYLKKGHTYCVVGSSGVGKSTLINKLLKRNILKTGEISRSTSKGKHITEHRELFILENGAIIIDTPGMLELGISENIEGLRTTFQDIYDLSLKCKFPDCRHTNEKGCAVLEALEKGDIDIDSYENFLKLRKERERFGVTITEKHRREKIFGKLVKNYYKDLKRNENQE